METIWFGFLLGIGLIMAFGVVALAPFLFRLVIFCCAALVALAVAALCLMITWHLLLDPWAALWVALPIVVTFGWIPCFVLVYFGFDRFMVWLRNDRRRPKRDYSQRLEIDQRGFHRFPLRVSSAIAGAFGLFLRRRPSAARLCVLPEATTARPRGAAGLVGASGSWRDYAARNRLSDRASAGVSPRTRIRNELAQYPS